MSNLYTFYKLLLNGYTLAYTYTKVEAYCYKDNIPCLEVEPFTTVSLPINVAHVGEIPNSVWNCLEWALN